VDGEVTFEYEIAAVFDLGNRVEARKVYSLTLLGGELRPQDKGPIVEPFTDDGGVQFVCSRLQCGNVINSQERVVGLAKADLCTVEFLLDKAVAVEVIRRLEGKNVATRMTMGPRTSSRM
jgi:hypothetical protein